jgi:hypothetical protein
LDTPDYFTKDMKNVEVWMDLLQKVFVLPIPQTNLEPNPYWGAKKWILHIIYRIFLNSNVLDMIEDENKKKFAKFFMERFSLPFLALCLNSVLEKNRGASDMPNRITALCYYYIGGAIRTKEIYQNALKSKVETIIKDVIFPQLIFTQEDHEMWHQDIQEYLRMNFAFIQDIYSPKIAAGNALQDLLDSRKEDAMPIFLNYFDTSFKQFFAETNPDRKRQLLPLLDGMLYALGNMKQQIMSDKTIRANLENVMTNYVLPSFSSPEPYIRAKACWVAGLYALIKWESKENLMNIVKAILNGLQDKQVPVKVQAGMALTGYLENKAITSEVLPILPQLLDVYVRMMQEMDYGDVVASIDYLVDAFRDQMEPYALELCTKMAARFLSIYDEDDEDDEGLDADNDDYGEGDIVCANCLRVIQTLLSAIGDKNQQMLRTLQELLVPLLVKVLVDPRGKGFEFFEEVCEVASCLTYFNEGPLYSPLMWQLFPALIHAFKDYASFYVHYIVPPIDNFISKGTDVFLSDAKNVEMIMQVIAFYMNDKEAVEKESQAAAMLASVLLQHCRGRIDHVISQLLQMIIQQLSTCETTALRILLVDCICDALLYNMIGTLSVMEKTNCTMAVFKMWLDTIPKMQRVYDKKLTVLALTTLLNHNDLAQLPKPISSNIHMIIHHCIKLVMKIHDQRIEEKAEREKAEKERDILHERIMNGEHYDIEDEGWESESDGEDYGEETTDVDVTGIMKTKPIQKLLKDISECEWDKQADDDELEEEDESFTSAIDSIDEKVVFGRSMIDFSGKYHPQFVQIVEKWSKDEQNALKQLMESANK